MTHPLVEQLRFTRREFQRALAGINDEQARRRFGPMNCISWNIGHMANHEQRCWFRPDELILPELSRQFGYGAPACEPPLAEVWAAWQQIVAAADPWLDTLTSEQLLAPIEMRSRSLTTSLGSLMQRVIYHYWYHLGESMAVRQLLGGSELPEFVGNIDTEAPYRVP